MNYLQGMKIFGGKAPMRRSAIMLAAALAVAACGGSTAESVAESSDDELETSTTVLGAENAELIEPDEQDPDVSPVLLGDSEAGFGQGSLAVLAGEYLDRVLSIEGNWLPGPPLTLDIPEVCEIDEPEALQGLILLRPVDATGVRADVLSAEVRVYETAEQAEALVSILNGDSADDCDRASLEVALESPVPGVTYDFGDGVGEPAPVPEGLPEGLSAESRSFDFEIIFGSVGEALIQDATVVADGRVVVSFSASSTPELVDGLEAELAAALFDGPTPQVIESPDLDVVVNDVRRSVLTDADLPDFFDPRQAMTLGGPGEPDVCFTSEPPVAAASGPFWFAFSPGVGGSELAQNARIYSDAETAAIAFGEIIDVGVDCFPEEIGEIDGFELIEARGDVVEIDGRSVAFVELDYRQSVGSQTFDVEAKVAITQFGEVLTSVRFFGLAGDSPELTELVAIVAERGAGNDS